MKSRDLFTVVIIFILLVSCNQQNTFVRFKSLDSLSTTIEGEVTAHAKYLSYAEKASLDSMPEMATLFRAASIAEKAHADRQITMLLSYGGSFARFDPQYLVGNISENLQDAIKVENYEAVDMYPGFIKVSKEEQLDDITESFTWALKAEEKHRDLFNIALLSLDNPDIKLPMAYIVCPRCGNTMDAANYISTCDICENDATRFVSVK